MINLLDAAPIGAWRSQRFVAEPVVSGGHAVLVWVPVTRSMLRLCWSVGIPSRARNETYQTLIDAGTGQVLVRRCLTRYLTNASYRVFTSDSPAPFSPGWSTPNTNQPSSVAR